MKHYLFDLHVGETLRLGEFKVTLLDVVGEDVVLEIDGPNEDGTECTEPTSDATQCREAELAIA